MFSECVYIYNRVSTKTYSGGHAHHGFQAIGLDVAGGNAGNGKPWLNPADTEGGLRRKAHRISSYNNFYKIIPIYISEKHEPTTQILWQLHKNPFRLGCRLHCCPYHCTRMLTQKRNRLKSVY